MIFIVKDNEPAKSTVIGSPILLDSEDDDETPSVVEDLGEFSYTSINIDYNFFCYMRKRKKRLNI